MRSGLLRRCLLRECAGAACRAARPARRRIRAAQCWQRPRRRRPRRLSPSDVLRECCWCRCRWWSGGPGAGGASPEPCGARAWRWKASLRPPGRGSSDAACGPCVCVAAPKGRARGVWGGAQRTEPAQCIAAPVRREALKNLKTLDYTARVNSDARELSPARVNSDSRELSRAVINGDEPLELTRPLS